MLSIFFQEKNDPQSASWPDYYIERVNAMATVSFCIHVYLLTIPAMQDISDVKFIIIFRQSIVTI